MERLSWMAGGHNVRQRGKKPCPKTGKALLSTSLGCQGGAERTWICACHKKSPPGSPNMDKERAGGPRIAYWGEANFLSSPTKLSSWSVHKVPARARQVRWWHSADCGPKVRERSKALRELNYASPSSSSWRTCFQGRG